MLKSELQAQKGIEDTDCFYIIGVDLARFDVNTAIVVVKCLPERDRLRKKVVNVIVLNNMSAPKQVVELKIDPEVVDKDDVEMLEDMIVAAINEAFRKADEMMDSEMKKVTGGVNIPGLF